MANYFGDDTSNDIDGGNQDDFIFGYGDDDYLHGNFGKDFITGGDGNDYLDGGVGEDSLLGGNDNDLLFGGDGADVLSGGSGRDMALYSDLAADVSINLMDGEGHGGSAEGDQLLSIEDLMTGNGDDNLIGNNVDNLISGGAGDDYIEGLGGDDEINGGAGDDQIAGGTGADTLDGGADIDTLSYYNSASGVTINLHTSQAQLGEAQGDIISGFENLVGSNFNDILSGSNAANVISGYAGDDLISARGGADTIDGGAGVDRLMYWGSATGVAIDLDAGMGFGGDAAGDTIDHVENIEGSNWADALLGDAGANLFYSGGGMDVLNGRGGADEMHGGANNDTYYVDISTDKVFEAAGGGTDTVYSSVSYTLAAGQAVEALATTSAAGVGAINLTGNEVAQTITGNAGANTINGGGGADTMHGLGGADMYYVDNAADAAIEAAGGGSDRVLTSVNYTLTAGSEVELFTTTNTAGVGAINLTGNALAQTIQGNAGVNILNGGAGNDVLTGFGGADVFVFNTALNAATNRDSVTDFSHAADTFNLDNAIFAQLGANGALNPLFFRSGSAAVDANDYIVYNQTTGGLFYDSNGSGAGGAVQFATLNNKPALLADDFVVI